MKQLGLSSKTIKELVEGDFLYYIDPKKPTEIQELMVKSVEPYRYKRYMLITYYQSTQVLDFTSDKSLIPTKQIIAEAEAKHFITTSMPPTVYFTNKRELQKFMGK